MNPVVIFIVIILVVLGCVMFGRRFMESLVGQSPCVKAHQSYPWLDHIHGGLDKIMYEEPAGSGNWLDYDDNIWAIHCKVIDHSAKNLVQSHMKAFVNPATRFARLHFYFKDGTIIEPTEEFYRLEAAWFAKHI